MSNSRSRSRSSPRRGRGGRSRSNSAPNQKLTCLHISNLGSKVVEQDLKEMFEKYGTIDYVKVCMEPRTQGKVSRGFGFVNFVDNEAANRAVKALQDTELLGKKIHLDFSKRGQPRRKTPGRYAGYLPRQRSRSRSRRRYRSSSSRSYSSRKKDRRRRSHSRSNSRRRKSSSYSDKRRKNDYSSRSRSKSRKDRKKRR